MWVGLWQTFSFFKINRKSIFICKISSFLHVTNKYRILKISGASGRDQTYQWVTFGYQFVNSDLEVNLGLRS